jgi:hypothetical protein
VEAAEQVAFTSETPVNRAFPPNSEGVEAESASPLATAPDSFFRPVPPYEGTCVLKKGIL